VAAVPDVVAELGWLAAVDFEKARNCQPCLNRNDQKTARNYKIF
jgi:hypothetical protein